MHNEVNMSQRIECVNAPTLIAPKGHYSHCVTANGLVFSQDNYRLISSGMR